MNTSTGLPHGEKVLEPTFFRWGHRLFACRVQPALAPDIFYWWFGALLKRSVTRALRESGAAHG
jgi:hypothetical protein